MHYATYIIQYTILKYMHKIIFIMYDVRVLLYNVLFTL